MALLKARYFNVKFKVVRFNVICLPLLINSEQNLTNKRAQLSSSPRVEIKANFQKPHLPVFQARMSSIQNQWSIIEKYNEKLNVFDYA